jgi:hypothetical protein
MELKLERRPTQHGKQLSRFMGKASKEELQALRELKAHLKATQGASASQMTLLVEAAKSQYPWFRHRVEQLTKETAKAEKKLSAKS